VHLLAVVGAFAVAPARAHHSFAAEFDYDLTGTIEGEVIEALYVNPHARYFVAVVDDAGNEQIWDAQTRSTSALTRVGWTRELIKVGDHVVLEGNLGNNNTRKIWIRKATMADGRIITPVAAATEQ
jgi:hypothetical protein